MSKKLTLNGWIVFEQWRWDKEPSFTWYGFRPDDEVKENFKRAVVCEQAIEIEVPDSFDPRPSFIQGLEEQKKKLQADFTARITEINAQIQQLQAIELSEA